MYRVRIKEIGELRKKKKTIEIKREIFVTMSIFNVLEYFKSTSKDETFNCSVL